MEYYQRKPSYIRNYHELVASIKLSLTEESITLDFKREINITEKKNKNEKNFAEELALDICQFANSWGGVLLIGVSEKEDKETGRKVADQFVGVTQYEKIARFINNSVFALIHPKNIQVDVVCIETLDRKQLISINISPLTTGVAFVCSQSPPYSSKYPYRTHYGKRYLHPLEVQKRMTDSNRIIPIKLQELMEFTQEVKLYPEIQKEIIDKIDRIDSKIPNIVLKEVMKNEYRLNINGIDINIPFSLTRDVWMTERTKIGIILHISLSISSDRKSIYFNI